MSGPQRELHVIDLLRSLSEHRVEHVVFGAVGAGLYGHVRATQDLDILVSPDADNLGRVAEWLQSLDAVLALDPQRAFGGREAWALRRGNNATVLTRLGQVDVVQRLDGLPSWEDIVARAEHYEIDDLEVRVLDRETLIALKRRRASLQDLADIEAIQALGD